MVDLTYVFADIHGRLDLLEAGAARVMAHLDGRVGRAIFLGDYVDRGPDSRGVIDFIMRAELKSGAICLRGNHEDMMLRACRDGDSRAAYQWFTSGGDATLASYGGRDLTPKSLGLVSEEHLAWLGALRSSAQDAHRIYVHAGLRPKTPLARQSDSDLLWIRDRFLRARTQREFPDGKHVVHGHTPQWAGKPIALEPELLGHRTNLDTGAFATGVLTIGVFRNDRPGGPVDLLRVGS